MATTQPAGVCASRALSQAKIKCDSNHRLWLPSVGASSHSASDIAVALTSFDLLDRFLSLRTMQQARPLALCRCRCL